MLSVGIAVFLFILLVVVPGGRANNATNDAAANLLPIDWLHIIKCGTTFINTLLRWACFPNVTSDIIGPNGGLRSVFTQECASNFVLHEGVRPNWPIGDHFDLARRNGTENTTYLQHVVTFVREPVSRTISHAFFAGKMRLFSSMETVTNMGGGDDAIIARYEELLWEYGVNRLRAETAAGFQTTALMGTSNATGVE
eukprot:gene38536-46841_t